MFSVQASVRFFSEVVDILVACPLLVLANQFTISLGGNLLLSDSGILGVVCSCHGVYMSIADFSEVMNYVLLHFACDVVLMNFQVILSHIARSIQVCVM